MEIMREQNLSQAFKGRFPVEKMMERATYLRRHFKGKKELDPVLNKELSELTHSEAFLQKYLSFIKGIDIAITRPSSGKQQYILMGSEFFFPYFRLLEDPELNQMMDKYKDYLKADPSIDRFDFLMALTDSAKLLSLVDLPHNLDTKGINSIVDYLITKNTFIPSSGWERSVILLHGGALALANILDHPNKLSGKI